MTDFPDGVGIPKSRKKFLLVSVSLIAVFLSIFLVLRKWSIEKFISDFAPIIYKTAVETFHARDNMRLAAEIDLNQTFPNEKNDVLPGENKPIAVFDAKEANPADTAQPKNDVYANHLGNSPDESGLKKPAIAEQNVSVSERQQTIAQTEVKLTNSESCSFANGSPSREVTLNEIAWMGALAQTGESAASAADREWIELKNNSGKEVDLSGWGILDDAGKFKIVFGAGDKIPSGSFYILERSSDDALPKISADKIYSGALSNSGMLLRLVKSGCGLVDEIDARNGWTFGDNETKQTLERNLLDFGWHTSAISGGTPKAQNSNPIPLAAAEPRVDIKNTEIFYSVSVSMHGGGFGKVSSNPSGINCGFDCLGKYKNGTLVTLIASPEESSTFTGWLQPCGASPSCQVNVTGTLTLVATFKLKDTLPAVVESSSPPVAPREPPVVSPAQSQPPPPENKSVNHLVIAEVQIAGASASNDFIKIYNPTNAEIDIGGWKLRKKTKPGTEYSIRVLPSGSVIGARGYFVWANSVDGFSASINAHASSTQTLAADNSIAFADLGGAIIDAVAWGSGHTSPFIESAAYPDNPSAGQILKRKLNAGSIQDTDNNSNDFVIQ